MKKLILITLLLFTFEFVNSGKYEIPANMYDFTKYNYKMVNNISCKVMNGEHILVFEFTDGSSLKIKASQFNMKVF